VAQVFAYFRDENEGQHCRSAEATDRKEAVAARIALRRQPFRYYQEHGAWGNRTPDLLNAIEALYQLS
jgi:hypothetical protein